MLTEVRTYVDAIDKAIKEHDERDDANRDKYRGVPYEEREPYYEMSRTITKDYHAALDAAWETLEDSTDPVVQFIYKNCKDYRAESTEVLKVLPATLDEIENLAITSDWCGVWDDFREKAVESGVFGEAGKMSAARSALKNYLINDYGMSRNNVRRVISMVNDIVTEALAEKAAEAATVES